MPTGFARPIGGNYAFRRNEAIAQSLAPTITMAGPPWQGYCPDVQPSLFGLGAARDVSGLVPHGEYLTFDDGWNRTDSGGVPLGTWTSRTSGAAGRAIMGIGFMRRSPSAGTSQSTFNYAITARTGSGDSQANALFYIMDFAGSSQWANMSFTGAQGSASVLYERATAGDFATFWPEFAVFAPQNKLIWVSGFNGDEAYEFSGVASPSHYQALTRTGTNYFQAKTCAAFDDRMVYGNTIENTTYFFQRVRWSPVGDADPYSATIGAGFIDLDEIRGQVVKVLPIADFLAVYSTDGVVLLSRTGLSTAPFVRQYITKYRGLLGPKAVVDLGNGEHFGVFQDGMFILDSNAGWREAGVRGNTTLWRRTFMNLISSKYASGLTCWYDLEDHYVRISFPSIASESATTPGRNDTVWVYDLQGDRMWPDDYSNSGGAPASYGLIQAQTQVPFNWGPGGSNPYTALGSGFAGSWAAAKGTWASYQAPIGQPVMAHGTYSGIPFQYVDALSTRDGGTHPWRYNSHYHNLGVPQTWKAADRVWVEYENVGGPGASVSVTSDFGAQTMGGTIAMTRGTTNTGQVEEVSGRISGQEMSVGVSGVHPAKLRSISLQTITERTEAIKSAVK